jgi:hypothetical protein
VEQWAEIRRLYFVEKRSKRAIHRLTGVHRDTITRAIESDRPPKYARASGSKLDPFKDWICEQLRADPSIQSLRLREMAAQPRAVQFQPAQMDQYSDGAHTRAGGRLVLVRSERDPTVRTPGFRREARSACVRGRPRSKASVPRGSSPAMNPRRSPGLIGILAIAEEREAKKGEAAWRNE